MFPRTSSLVAVLALASASVFVQAKESAVSKPTIVLVHGSFAESSS